MSPNHDIGITLLQINAQYLHMETGGILIHVRFSVAELGERLGMGIRCPPSRGANYRHLIRSLSRAFVDSLSAVKVDEGVLVIILGITAAPRRDLDEDRPRVIARFVPINAVQLSNEAFLRIH